MSSGRSERSSGVLLSTISINEFYKIPQLYELENFEVHTSSEEALLDK